MKKKWLKVGVALLLVTMLALQPLAGVVTLAETTEALLTAEWTAEDYAQRITFDDTISQKDRMQRWVDGVSGTGDDNGLNDSVDKLWLRLDFGKSYYLTKYNVLNCSNDPAWQVGKFSIYGSQDSARWDLLVSYDNTVNTQKEIEGAIESTKPYRYVKLQIDQRCAYADNDWVGIDEFEIYGTPLAEGEEDPSSDPLTLVTDGWDTADIVENTELGSIAQYSKRMYQWFDGVTGQDNWIQDDANKEGKYRPNYWVILDLKRAYTFAEFIITGREAGNNVKAFEFLGSNDKEDWTQVVSVTDNTADVAEGAFSDQTNAYRYIKLHILDPNQSTDENAGSLNIDEVQIYGNTTEELPTEEPKQEMSPYAVLATEGWDIEKAKAQVTIGSNEKIYNWFDNSYSEDTWFEDNSTLDQTNAYYRSNYWAIVDLGEARALTGYSIVAKESNNNVRAFEFFGSNDQEIWVSLAREEKHVYGNAEGVFGDQETAYRYVKLQILDRNQNTDSGNGWIGISEVELYALPSEEEMAMVAVSGKLPEGSVHLTQNWSSEEYDSNVTTASGLTVGEPRRWMNGIDDSNWCEIRDSSAWWLEVDLKAEQTLTGFKMYSEDIGVDGYNDGPICDVAFYGKNNAEDEWTRFAIYKGNTENELTAALGTEATYRYVRFEITKLRKNQDTLNSDHRWFSLREVELYGLATEPTFTYDEEDLVLDITAPEEGDTVTITVPEGKTLKAGSLRIVDADGNVLAVPERKGFRTDDVSNVFTFEMPAGAAAVTAEFVDANSTEPNMGLEGWSTNAGLSGLRSVYRMYVTEEDGKYYTTIGGEKKEVAEYGVLVGVSDDVSKAKKADFTKTDRRYDVCGAYQDLSVTVTGLDNDQYRNTPIYSWGYVLLAGETEPVYTEIRSKTYAEAVNR